MVFYNGDEKYFPEDVKELHLSDAFDEPVEAGKYEWTATMININHGKNKTLMESCQVLEAYSHFTAKVKEYSKFMNKKEAVDRAVDESIEKGGKLGEFLGRHKREVKNMILTEFDEEKYLEMVKEDSYMDGLLEGRQMGQQMGRLEGVKSTLIHLLSARFDSVPQVFTDKLHTADEKMLQNWIVQAATASSMDEFLEKI